MLDRTAPHTGLRLKRRFSAVWDKRAASGAIVPAGDYIVRVTSTSSTASALPYSRTVEVSGAPVPPGDPAPEHPVNRTPGMLYTSTHQWRTACGAYSTAAGPTESAPTPLTALEL